MELLNNNQAKQISGGFELVTIALGAASALGLALGIYNFVQLNNLTKSLDSFGSASDSLSLLP